MQIPDAPWIRDAELNGYPPYEPEDVRCPICGKECDTIYTDKYGEAFGCEYCVTEKDSWEWADENKED